MIPGFIVEIKETEPSGRRVYGKYKRYAPHAEIDEIILREYIKQGFSEMRTHRALNKRMYPLFPADLQYMETLSSLRKATKLEGVGYLISPSMISSLVVTPELSGMWTWGDIKPIPDNHDNAVPVELWIEAFSGKKEFKKPRGRGINREPLEWDGLLWCCNHDIPSRISGHTGKSAYRCQKDYVQGGWPSCLDITAHFVDKPLIEAVLQRLTFTPMAEEVLMQTEADYSHLNLEVEEQKRYIAEYNRRLKNLKEILGWDGGDHERVLLEQIDETQHKLDELKSRPVPARSTPVVSYPIVKDFLVGLPDKWHSYSRRLRNRLLKSLIDHVDVRHEWPVIESNIYWRTGQKQVVEIHRARDKGNRESRWTEEEKELLTILWPSTSQETIMASIPARTLSAIRHQAQTMGLKRIKATCNCVSRHRWSLKDETKAKQDYEAGVAVDNIAVGLHRSYSAIMQRASEKGWKRPHTKEGGGANYLPSVKQRPMVSNGVCSGSISGGQITFTAGIGPRIFDKHL